MTSDIEKIGLNLAYKFMHTRASEGGKNELRQASSQRGPKIKEKECKYLAPMSFLSTPVAHTWRILALVVLVGFVHWLSHIV